MKHFYFFSLFVLTSIFSFGQGVDCSTAVEYCSNNTTTYPASTNTSAPVGPNYGCLGSQPNPAFFYFKISTSGSLTLSINSSANVDVDFICWGPFNSLSAACASGLIGNSADCSYSATSSEICTISNGIAGQYYILMVTNYSNQATNINISQTSGNGYTDCQVCIADIANDTANFCPGTNNTINATITNASSCVWSGPGNYSYTGTSAPLNNVNSSMEGYYYATANDSGCASTDSIYVNITNDPVASFTYNVTGTYVTFNNTSTGANNYYWVFGDGTAPSTQTNPSHAYPSYGSYVIYFITYGTCTSDTLTKTITIGPLGSGNSYNKDSFTVTQFPKEKINLGFNTTQQNLEINIFSISGQLIYSEAIGIKNKGESKTIDLSAYPEGVYMIRIVSEKEIYTAKIIR